MMEYNWEDSVLRVMLLRLPPDELVETLIRLVRNLIGDNEEALREFTHTVVTTVHAREVVTGEMDLRRSTVSEEHKREVFREVLKTLANKPIEIDEFVANSFFDDWMKSDLPIHTWWVNLSTDRRSL